MTDDVHEGGVHEGGVHEGGVHEGGVHKGGVHEGEPLEVHSCDDVLSHVFEFLDHETDDSRRAVIAEHLEDCSSCLRQFGIEAEFKALVRRRCGGDVPPPGLRDRIKLQLTSVSFEEDGTSVSVQQVRAEWTGERPTA